MSAKNCYSKDNTKKHKVFIMKTISAIILFFCCNALLIFFEVHKQGQYLKLSYEIQKLQTEITTLTKQQNELTYSLHKLQQPDIIQEVAEKKLNMKKIELKNIKSMPTETIPHEINQ